MRARVLLIGGASLAEEIRAAVEEAGGELRAEGSLSAGLAALAEGGWRATFLDAATVEEDEALVRRIAEEPGSGALVLVARAPSLRLALEAPRMGAADLLYPPVERARVAALLRGEPSAAASVPLPEAEEGDALVGASPALLDVFRTVGRVAASDATVPQ